MLDRSICRTIQRLFQGCTYSEDGWWTNYPRRNYYPVYNISALIIFADEVETDEVVQYKTKTKTKTFADFQIFFQVFLKFHENWKLLYTTLWNLDYPWTFSLVMWGPTQNLSPIGQVVLTFIGYKRTNEQIEKKSIYKEGVEFLFSKLSFTNSSINNTQ